MDHDIEGTLTNVDRDLSTEWIELGSRVRELAGNLHTKTVGTSLADDAAVLASETARLCDHLERIHRDVETLLVELDEKIPEMGILPSDIDADAVQREAIQIQRETHELRADFKDIIKALFMRKDDPVARAREKQ